MPLGRLAQRSHQPELMDGPGLGDAVLQARVLADLASVNRLTRTHAPVLQFLRQAWAGLPAGQRVSVLDVGCGEGDLLRAIWRLGTRLGRPLRLTGLDLHPDSTQAAQAATPPVMRIRYVTADALAYVPPPTDYIVQSQLAHHLDDAQLVALLRWQQRHARRGWCVADLRRAWLPYLGFRWLARAAGWHRVVRLDGTLSIARACTPAEWQALLQQAGVAGEVRRHMPFRLTVRGVAPGNGPPR
jgi:SAM-dependent methyltransferase